jgi:O-antigen/teichoic acid export membrane protein
MSSLKEKTAAGLFWGATSTFLTQLISMIIGFYLARILSPADYGLVGMLAIFSAIAGTLQESGFTAALTNLKKVTSKEYNAVFWFSTTVSTSLYLILFFCAPLIAKFYHQPELTSLSRLVFASFVVAGIGTAHSAYMFRNMMNKEKAIIGAIASLLSGLIGVYLASQGYSYWSLAWQQFAFIAITDIGRLYYVRWLPNLHIDFTPIRKMFAFSSKLLVTSIITQVNNNILTIIFGRLFSAKSVGNFTQAFKWDSMAYQFVSGTISQVAQPVLSSISDEKERQLKIFRKMLRFTAFISFPAMFGLSLVAREFILITIHDQWLDSIPLLRILCISGAFFPFFTLYQNLVISEGRSDINMWCNISFVAAQLILFIGFHFLSMSNIVSIYAAINILWILIWQNVAKKLIGITFMDFARDIMPFLLASATTCGIAYIATSSITNLTLLLFLRIIIVGVMYFMIMKICHAQILEDCIGYFLDKIKKR